MRSTTVNDTISAYSDQHDDRRVDCAAVLADCTAHQNLGDHRRPSVGSPLIVSSDNSNISASYVITPLLATAAAGSPYTIGAANPISSVFSRNGNFFYTGGNSGNFFAGFSVNAATGLLTALAGSLFDSGNNAPAAQVTDGRADFFW